MIGARFPFFIFARYFCCMKAKHALLMLALGFCLDFVGSYMKILHRGSADLLLLLAVILKVAGVLLLAFKLVRYSGLQRFLNS
jgi:hypothetical protein